jgi:hypothetical protein
MSQKNVFQNRRDEIFSSDVIIKNLHLPGLSKFFTNIKWFSGFFLHTLKFIGNIGKEDLEHSLILISNFATTEGINLAKQSIEFLKNTKDNIRISFVSSSEKIVSKRIFCKSMVQETQLSDLSEMFDSLSIPVESSKDCDSEFHSYASDMHDFVKELELVNGRTYVMFGGRVLLKIFIRFSCLIFQIR